MTILLKTCEGRYLVLEAHVRNNLTTRVKYWADEYPDGSIFVVDHEVTENTLAEYNS